MVAANDLLRQASPQMELVGIARNPVPNGAVPGSFVTRDGLTIRYALWPRTADRRLGTVCLFSGRGEFIEKYFETITDLRRRGFAVAMMDWRGQGGSDRLLKNPRKGHVEDFTDFDKDLGQFMSEIVLPDCPGAVLRHGAFDGRAYAAALGADQDVLVRPHHAFGADDRHSPRIHPVDRCCAIKSRPRCCSGWATSTSPAASRSPRARAVRGQQADQRSLAL